MRYDQLIAIYRNEIPMAVPGPPVFTMDNLGKLIERPAIHAATDVNL
jgi:hypothetical protein